MCKELGERLTNEEITEIVRRACQDEWGCLVPFCVAQSMDPLDPWDLGGWQDRVLESFEFSRKEHSYTTPLVVSVSMFAVV